MRLLSQSLLILVLMVLVPSVVHADSNEKYCYLMVAIYGACSPELVNNYLAKTAPQVYRPPCVIPQVKPSLTIASTVTTIISEANVTTEPNVRYTWYWNNVRWVRGRFVG